ncbi:protein lifeguard 3-like [Gopherus evgoodei]|uniref:protein lifeguard 3-like n=1 Tax=Gopherus evgoodei TaxID=1825980 RepID=UPI0011CFF9A3|nr:protein lifeguard 3-like [Gopherus evgoodei]
MAFMTGTIASMYNTRAVLITMVITAKVAIIVTVFCFQTKVDFTSCTGLFCVLGIVVVQTSIVTAIVLYYKYIQWVHMVFTAMAAIAFTLFLAYDTQLLVGNKQYGLSPEEYIFGALEIYVDIVYIFLFLLRFLGWKYSLQQGSWLAQPGAEEHSGKTSLPSCFCSFLPPYPSVCLPANGLWFPPFPVEPSVGFPQSVPRVVAGETVPWKSPIMRLCPAMTPELADLCLPR